MYKQKKHGCCSGMQQYPFFDTAAEGCCKCSQGRNAFVPDHRRLRQVGKAYVCTRTTAACLYMPMDVCVYICVDCRVRRYASVDTAVQRQYSSPSRETHTHARWFGVGLYLNSQPALIPVIKISNYLHNKQQTYSLYLVLFAICCALQLPKKTTQPQHTNNNCSGGEQ